MKSKYLTLVAILCFGGLFTGCKSVVEDGEMKGVLTVDKSAFGNAYLEFNDPESKQVRFIHPGRKIITIQRSGVSNLEISMMDARRVQLAKIKVPTSAFKAKTQTFSIPAKSLNQQWDLRGTQKLIPLRTEFHPTRFAIQCQMNNCSGSACSGWKGQLFKVTDFRYDYELIFAPENTNLVWGRFVATGEHRTSTQIELHRSCQPAVTVYEASKELFQ